MYTNRNLMGKNALDFANLKKPCVEFDGIENASSPVAKYHVSKDGMQNGIRQRCKRADADEEALSFFFCFWEDKFLLQEKENWKTGRSRSKNQ
jgi:hypothetical protein